MTKPTLEKIGLLGGTFDPIHRGHLYLAKSAKAYFALDKLLLIPVGHPPHRKAPVASFEQRITLIQLATQDWHKENPQEHREWLSVSTLDAPTKTNATPNYTYNLLEKLRAEHPLASLIWLLGEDAFLGFDRWYRFTEILSLCHLVVCTRRLPHTPPPLLSAPLLAWQDHQDRQQANINIKPCGTITHLSFPSLPFSSSTIRQNLKTSDNNANRIHEATKLALCPSVLSFIQTHYLYF